MKQFNTLKEMAEAYEPVVNQYEPKCNHFSVESIMNPATGLVERKTPIDAKMRMGVQAHLWLIPGFGYALIN